MATFAGKLFLNLVGQVEALALVEALRKREKDIGFGAVGVEVVVSVGVVLQQDGRVFLFGHLKVFLVFRLTHDEGLGTVCRIRCSRGVAVDGDEHVGIVTIGDGSTLTQLDELVRLAGIDHLHIGKVFFDIRPKLERDGQIQRLLGGHLAQGACILAAVARINHDGLYLFALLRQGAQRQQKNQEKNTKSGNLSFYHIEFVYLCAKKNYLCSGFQSHKSNRFHVDKTHDIYEIFS